MRETIGMLRRTLARLDVSSRSMYRHHRAGDRASLGVLFELALAADRSYMLALPEEEGAPIRMALDDFNFGLLPTVNGRSRLETRFSGDKEKLAALEKEGQAFGPGASDGAGPGHACRPTISIGKTKFASPSRSGPACRRMR